MVNIGRIPEKWAALTPRGDAVVDTTTGRRTSWPSWTTASAGSPTACAAHARTASPCSGATGSRC